MARNMNSAESPTSKAMDRAIDLAIEGNSPYPEHAAFVDAESPHAGQEITRALDEGYAVVLVSADGRKDAMRSILDGASYLLSPVGDPSLRPLATTRAMSADHAALLADWLVSGFDVRQTASCVLRQHDEAQCVTTRSYPA